MPAEPIDTAVVALRAFVHGSGALRAQALLPQADGRSALVSCTRLGPLEVIVGERAVELPHDVEIDAAPPDLEALRPLPPFEVDAAAGQVAGVIGGLDLLAGALRTVARAIGGGAAVVAELETTTPDMPLVLSAREGEALLVTLGEESFELDG